MKYSNTTKSLITSLLLTSSVCHISISMERRGDNDETGGKAALPSLRMAAKASSPNPISPNPISPGRDDVTHPKKAITHPTVLNHDQLRKIFSPKHEHNLSSTMESRRMEVDIAGQKVTVYAAPKSHKDDDVRNLFKDPNAMIVGRFKDYLIEKRGPAHTMAAAGADCATIPGFLLYYVNPQDGVEVPVTYNRPGTLIYIAFAAKYEDLPKVLDDEPSTHSITIPTVATTPPQSPSRLIDREILKERNKEADKATERKEKKEKEDKSEDKKRQESKERRPSDAKKTSLIEDVQASSKEQKHKSLAPVLPMSGLKSSILFNMLKSPDRALSVDEEAQNLYQVILINDQKRALYIDLLGGDEGAKYFAKFVKITERNITTGPLTLEGKITHLCKYELWKTGKRDGKAKVPEGVHIENPEKFHKFLISWHTAKS